MKKILLTASTLVSLVGCTPLPRTEIHVISETGAPISGLPLRIEFSGGLKGYSLPASVDSEFSSGSEVIDVRTDDHGKVAVEYVFSQRQPSKFRSLFPGTKWVPNQWIKITPKQDIPRGSTITLGVPNP